MNVIGQEIIHKFFQTGIITAFDKKYTCANFPSKGKLVNLSFTLEYFQSNQFPDFDASNYLSTLINEIIEEKKTNKQMLERRVESPYHLALSDLPIHNMVSDVVQCPIIICPSPRSFIITKDHIYESRKHDTEMRNMIVGCLECDGNANIGVEYCFDCDDYYIDEYGIHCYVNRFGRLILIKRYERLFSGSVSQSSISWDNATFLKDCGYNVRASGLGELQRHRLLSYLIDNNVMKLMVFIATTKQAIKMGRDMHFERTILANRKRQDDLAFFEK